MLKHNLKIGDVVFDSGNDKWGVVALISGKEENTLITEDNEDAIVLLMDAQTLEKRVSEWETMARDCYVLCDSRKFQGYPICMEHLLDELGEFDEYFYDFYCPERKENCFCIETDEIPMDERDKWIESILNN